MVTHWTNLAKQLGALSDDGSQRGGIAYAQNALEDILGEEWIETTVEHALSFKGGCELAMNCLCYIKSAKAAHYTYSVYKSSTDDERANRAAWLIKQLAHPVSFGWIEEFLNDRNSLQWGLGLLDQLLWTKEIAYDDRSKYLLDLADKNSEGQLKEQTGFIRKYLEERSPGNL